MDLVNTSDLDHHTLMNIQMTLQVKEQNGNKFLLFALITNDIVSYSNLKDWLVKNDVEYLDEVNEDKVLWTFFNISTQVCLALTNNYKSIATN